MRIQGRAGEPTEFARGREPARSPSHGTTFISNDMNTRKTSRHASQRPDT